jgi:hypothetical protein
MDPSNELPRMDRRVAIKWMLTATASLTIMGRIARAATDAPPLTAPTTGYGPDPDLLKTYAPGDLWPLTLTAGPRRTVTVLSDIIIPADAQSPAASAVGITDFIDEWISSPYLNQAPDRKIILEGLDWLDAKAKHEGGEAFFSASHPIQQKICRDLAIAAKSGDRAPPARFFKRFRDLVAGGYYTTPIGMKDIGYVGNVPLAAFPGPTPEALQHLGLA